MLDKDVTEPSQNLKGEKDYIRMSFNISIDVHNELVETIPWGVRGAFIESLVKMALHKIKTVPHQDSYSIIGAIIKGAYDPFSIGEEDAGSLL